MLGLRHRRLAGASGERHRLNLGLQEDDKIHDNCLLSAETFFGPASGEHRSCASRHPGVERVQLQHA